MNASRRHASLGTAALLLLPFCNGRTGLETYTLGGATMGTTYTVRLLSERLPKDAHDDVQNAVNAELELVDALMSTYEETSEVSRFNRFEKTSPFPVSAPTMTVLQEAKRIGALSSGALDVTLLPLVSRWGFGPDPRHDSFPSEGEIARLLSTSGLEKLELDERGLTLQKKDARVQIDLSAIAKGYAVDRVAERLLASGYTRFMVEVGGEVRTAGLNASNAAWRIAVESPIPGTRALHRVIPLSGLAMATSGDYRNYVEDGGRSLSHTLDPRTGRPIEHGLASVTVIDPSCMRADGLATALLVLGPVSGPQLAEKAGIAALFLTRSQGGDVDETLSTAFSELPGYNEEGGSSKLQ